MPRARRFWLFACLLIAVTTANARQSTPAIKGWGDVFDPKHDSKIAPDGTALVVDVAAAPHVLEGMRSKQTAPRVMKDVEGNHATTLQVTGKPADGQSAGFLIWLDEGNFVRFARTATGIDVDHWQDAQQRSAPTLNPDALKLTGDSVFLRYTRRIDKLKLETSPDGNTWAELTTIPIRFSSRLMIGTIVTNPGGQAGSFRFDGLKIKGIPLYPTGN